MIKVRKIKPYKQEYLSSKWLPHQIKQGHHSTKRDEDIYGHRPKAREEGAECG